MIVAQRRNRSRGLFDLGPQARSQSLEVSLALERGQSQLVIVEDDVLDVQLVKDDIAQHFKAAKGLNVPRNNVDLRQRLPDLERVLGPQQTPQPDHGHHGCHLRFQFLITLITIGRGEVTEVHGFGHAHLAQVPVDRLAYKRNKRRRNLGQLQQHRVKGLISLGLILVVLRFPEATPAAPDVPVGQIIDKNDEGAHGALQVIAIHGIGHGCGQRFE